jgi:hypothetical protein
MTLRRRAAQFAGIELPGQRGISTISAPSAQSGRRSTTVPSGLTRAASPGKSSSTVEPACVATAIQMPRRRAWRAASPRHFPSHQENPDLQESSSVRRLLRPGAAGKRTSCAPAKAAVSNGGSKPDSAQMATPNVMPANSIGVETEAGVNDSSPSPRCRFRCTPMMLPPAANTWAMCARPSDEPSATPKQIPTPVSLEACTRWKTASWSSDIRRSGFRAGSTEPVSDISGNRARSQPVAAASPISPR